MAKSGTAPIKILFMRSGGYFMDVDPPDAPMIGIPRSILYLAGLFTDDPGVETRFLDVLAGADFARVRRERNDPPIYFGMGDDEVVRSITDFNPRVVAVTCTANYYFSETVRLIGLVRRHLPGAFIVLGGPDATNDCREYFDRAPGIDVIVMREGEIAFRNLVAALRTGGSWKKTKGIAYRDKGGIVLTDPQPYVGDLDELACDYSIVDLERYFSINKMGYPSRLILRYPGSHRSIDLVTSRGCDHACSFCCIHLHMGRTVRTHSAARVLDEMRYLIDEHGVRNFHFEDDSLLYDAGRFKDILRGIIDNGWNITWDTPNGVRADQVDEELVRLCRESGCAYLIFGVESGSKKVLDTIVRKELGLEDVANACRLCFENEIDTLAFYIFGLPGETKADLLKTYYFAFDMFKKYNATPIFQLWRPYRNTDMEKKIRHASTVAPSVVYALHEETKIPYTLFYSRVYEDAEITIEFLAYYFNKYVKDAARYAFVNWLSITRRRPLVLARFIVQILFFVIRAYAVPSRARSKLKEYMIGPGILPFAQLRRPWRR